MGTTVPTKIVGTPNEGFLLAVPPNLSEQTTIYDSASRSSNPLLLPVLTRVY